MPVLIECATHHGYLPLEPIDEVRAIASINQELRRSEPCRDELDLPLPVLGVDHVDATRSDHDVIDVALAFGHTTVVQHDRRTLGQPPFERRCDRPLAEIA